MVEGLFSYSYPTKRSDALKEIQKVGSARRVNRLVTRFPRGGKPPTRDNILHVGLPTRANSS